ncbi:FTH2 [Candida theae]|uniref:FTH2 n=1 Tax=Candida theae TaxID=1198502 RepID=A0AAD5BCL8_9ASCO|nr:FTH2 [Candida theae]KAI5955448.1 FTH2 [Candida theae]
MAAIEDYFSIQIFFIILRETLESAIIISVLLSFINQRSHKSDASSTTTNSAASNASSHLQRVQRKLKIQVWVGAVLGLFICFLIGLVFILAFYFIGKDYWSYTERVWEGVFSILSSVIITVMGIGLLRINKVMKLKWWIKLGDAYNNEDDEAGEEEIAKFGDDGGNGDIVPDEFEDGGNRVNSYGGTRSSLESESAPLTTPDQVPVARKKSPTRTHRQKFGKKYFLAILPLVTTLREGLEAVVFVGGIGVSSPPSAFPLSIACGLALGAFVGYLLYKGGNKLSLQYFLITSTCFLYIVSAGLMSRGVWFLELESFVRKCGGLDVSETGSGPGSYDIAKSVWHVNCCNGLTDGGWMVLNAIFGWTNSATYGSVFTYMAYWIFVIVWLNLKLYEEREGVLPIIPIKWQLKRIRKKIRLYELRNSQSLHTISQQEAGVVQAEQHGLLE